MWERLLGGAEITRFWTGNVAVMRRGPLLATVHDTCLPLLLLLLLLLVLLYVLLSVVSPSRVGLHLIMETTAWPRPRSRSRAKAVCQKLPVWLERACRGRRRWLGLWAATPKSRMIPLGKRCHLLMIHGAGRVVLSDGHARVSRG